MLAQRIDYRLHLTPTLICLAIIAVCRAPVAAEVELIPRQALFAAADRPVVQLSHDGKKIAYIEVNGSERTVWVAPFEDLEQRKRVELSQDGLPVMLRWATDGTRLIVQQRVAQGVQLLAYDFAKANSIALTPKAAVTARLEKLSAQMPHQALVAINDRDPKVHDLWMINLANAERELIVQGGDFRKIHVDGRYQPRVAEKLHKDGQLQLFRRTNDHRWIPFRIFDIDRTNTQRAIGAGVQGVLGVDGSGELLYLVDNADLDKSVLLSVDLASQQETTLVRDRDSDISPRAIVDRVTGKVLGVSAQFDRVRRHFIDDSIRDDFAVLQEHFENPVGVINISAQDETWLVVPFDGGPVYYYVYERSLKSVTPLFSAHGVMQPYSLAKRSSHLVVARDGLRIPCHLYLPPGSDRDSNGLPDVPLPTVIYVHGGPHVAYPWDSWYTNRCLQLLANRGYAALRIEFRGAGGFGKEFVEQGWQQWGGDSQRDIVDIARWAAKNEIAPKDKIGIWGWSFGGLSTFAALAFYPDEFACGISMYGLSDLEMFARRVSLFGRGLPLPVGDPNTESGRQLLREQSPLHFAEQVIRPILVTHGEMDRVSPKRHSDLFVEALQRHGKEVTYLVYPNEGHDYRQSKSWTSFWAVAERFLNQHLGGRFEPYNDDLDDVNLQIVAGRELVPGLSGIN